MAIWTLTQNFIPDDILHSKEVRSPLLSVVDINNNNIYSLPSDKPNVLSVLESDSNGNTLWANASGFGNPNALLNNAPSVSAIEGAVIINDGTSQFNCIQDPTLKINGDIVSITGESRYLNTASPLNLGVIALTGTGTGDDNFIINHGLGGSVVLSQNDIELLTVPMNGDVNLSVGSGTVNINSDNPKLNFKNSNFPSQQCNIEFKSANEELIMEHHSPDEASRCNIRLGKNDINIDTIAGLQSGNIILKTGGSKHTFINNYNLPNTNPTQDTQLLSCNTDGNSSWISTTGLLRAINCNLFTPEPSEIIDVIWSNLTPAEQLAWKGGDPATIDPVQSATGNYWNFTKSAPSTNKIGWTIPDDLSALSFQDLQSFWVVIRFNNTTNISTEGSLYLSIQTNPPTGLNTFRTRWNYSNPATAMNQTGYFYKLYALDTITTTTTANFGKGQEVGQQKFKNNPCNVSPELWSIALNKLVVSPTGDTTAGYTTAPLQSISLQTASNIHTFNFDVVSIGYLNKQYNLYFS